MEPKLSDEAPVFYEVGLLEGFMAPMKSESDLPFSILGSCAE